MSIRGVSILGVKMDLGADRRGVDMGPSAIRHAGLSAALEGLGISFDDRGDISAEIPELANEGDPKARYLDTILRACAGLATRISEVTRDGSTPLVLGGDHSIAIGTLAGLHEVYGAGAVIWIDAHPDLNSPRTTPSGNVHGMGLATALGLTGFAVDGKSAAPWIDPARTVLIGLRKLDPDEKRVISESGVHVFTMTDIDKRGIAQVMGEVIEVVQGATFVHVSVDMDAFDPEAAPGVGTPVRGGLTYREGHLCLELIAKAGVLTSLEVVEVNPILDVQNATGLLAVEVIASAFGATIL